MKYLLIAMFTIFLIKCEKGDSSSDKKDCPKAKSATIVDLTGLDGCGLMLELEDGSRLEPINLMDFESKIPTEAGSKLWVETELAEGMASICMAGQIVKITCAEKRD